MMNALINWFQINVMERICPHKTSPYPAEKSSILEWSWLSRNPAAVHILEQNVSKKDWKGISKDEAAIHFMEMNMEQSTRRIPPRSRTSSSSSKTSHTQSTESQMAEQNTDKANWSWVLRNPSDFKILEQYL